MRVASTCAGDASAFFIHAYWALETTKTTFKNNIILKAHLEHSESLQFEDRQTGAGELARAHKASCFQTVVSINGKSGGELRRCAAASVRHAMCLVSSPKCGKIFAKSEVHCKMARKK